MVVEIENIIPSNTKLTFLVRVSELHEISAEDAAKTIGEGILDLEKKKNFKVTDISPYFDCFAPSDMIIKLDILILKPFFPEELISTLARKLEEIKIMPKGPISNLYCPSLIRILEK